VEILKEKILVLHTSFLGDAILALPFIQELKRLHPDSEIDVVSSERGFDVFKNSPVVESVFLLDKRGEHKSLRSTIRFAKTFADQGYAKLYSLHRSFRSSMFSFFTGIKDSYSFANSSVSFVYKHRIPHAYQEHEVKRLLHFLPQQYSEDEWRIRPLINADETVFTKDFAKRFFDTEKIIAIAPGTVWETKRYPEASFKALIQMVNHAGYRVILIGGISEKEFCRRLLMSDVILNLAGRSNIPETIALLGKCALLISNDSAPTHMGTAANIPVLTIYCSTVPEYGFYPYLRGSDYIELQNLSCKPCGIHGYTRCPLKHFKCGNDLPPKNVFEKALSMIRG
jgi:heptosyltransferase-2